MLQQRCYFPLRRLVAKSTERHVCGCCCKSSPNIIQPLMVGVGSGGVRGDVGVNITILHSSRQVMEGRRFGLPPIQQLIQVRGFVSEGPFYNRRRFARDPDMRKCTSIEGLTQTAYDNKDNMSPRGMAAFWSLVSKFVHRSSSRPTSSPSKHMQMQMDHLMRKTLQSIDTYGYRDIATIAISLAKIVKKVGNTRKMHQEGSTGQIMHNVVIGNNSKNKQCIFNEIADASIPIINDFEARHLSNLIYAYGLVDYTLDMDDGNPNNNFFGILADAAIHNLKGFGPQDLSNMVWAYANVGECHPTLFKEAGDAIAASESLDEFWPQALSNTVWAYATTGESHSTMFKKVADHIIALNNFDGFWPQALSNIVWAFATAGESHPMLFKKLADHIGSLEDLDKFYAQDFSITLWAYATAGESHPMMFKKLADHVVSLNNLDEFKPQELKDMSWAYATARESHPALFEKLSGAAIKKQNEFKSQELANFLWAYATNGQIDRHLFSSIVPAVKKILWKYNAQDLANIAWAYAVANVDAPSVFNDEFINACLQKEDEFNHVDLFQLHQWQLWQEELKSNVRLPPSLQEKCYEAFISRVPEPSKLQDDVISHLSSMGLELEEELLTKSGYRLDTLVEVNGKKVGVEVDGPFHFIGRNPNGSTILKRRQVTTLDGIPVVSVPYWEWDKLGKLGKNSDKKEKYLRDLLDLG